MPRREDSDPLLSALLRPNASREARDEAIRELVVRRAMPLVDSLLRNWIARGSLEEGEVADVKGDVTVRLMRALRRTIEEAESEAIASFSDYVEATVHNAMHDHRRRRYPLRHRLASRVRYVITHTIGLGLWGREAAICGTSAWEGEVALVPVAAPATLLGSAMEDARELRRVVVDILRRSGGPVALDELVAKLAAALPLAAEPFVPASSAEERSETSDPLSRLEGRQYLSQLWVEIAELPVRQRRALLLQLRIDDGESVAGQLLVYRIAGVRELAETLEMPLAELLALWNELPLADRRIAEMLGVTRQQVINLRKSARERLSRRMGRVSGS